MRTRLLEDKFSKMGARVKFEGPGRNDPASFVLDVQADRHGEFFEIRAEPDDRTELTVLDLRPAARHLLLMARDETGKHKFLCGHDERHWFVAAIPEKARGVTGVATAMDALKPRPVRRAETARHLRTRDRRKRRNAAFVRQGEWFFVPAPSLQPDPMTIRRNEPIFRGRRGSKAHTLEECYRTRGETVYVNRHHPRGLLVDEYQDLIRREPEQKKAAWRVLTRNAGVYARGSVRHADHKTIHLDGWHRVLMNTEHRAKAMRQVAFLD